MIEDMTARRLGAGTQRLHISSCKRFAAKSVQAKPASPHRGTRTSNPACGWSSPIGLIRMMKKGEVLSGRCGDARRITSKLSPPVEEQVTYRAIGRPRHNLEPAGFLDADPVRLLVASVGGRVYDRLQGGSIECRLCCCYPCRARLLLEHSDSAERQLMSSAR